MRESLKIKGIRFGEGRPVVCVPVVERDREAVVEKVRSLTAKGVKMIEWRADCFGDIGRPEEVRAVLEDIRPLTEQAVVLFTVRTKNQGGNAKLPERDILYLNGIAAKSGCVDLVDLEYFEASNPEREIGRLHRAGVRVTASHHDFSGTPGDPILHQIMARLSESGADIAKLAVMPGCADDVIRLFKVSNDTRIKYPRVPLITISMGPLGVVSRVAGEAFGSCVTFGADGETSAPGQLQAGTLGRILDALHEGMGRPRPAGHIYLIGFMGAGKTTVSAELTRITGVPGTDLDEEIVREAGISVTEIFERYGEEYFREKETLALAAVSKREPAVVACGGGCVLREENLRLMRESGTVVLLTAEPGTIYERVKDDPGRPVLNGHMDPGYISGLMEKRRPAYEAVCDFSVGTDGKTPEGIAEEILDGLNDK